VQLRHQPALLVARVDEERHSLTRLHALLHQVAGREELGVGLMRPAEPIGAAGGEQAGAQRLPHGVLADPELVLAHGLGPAGERPNQHVFLVRRGR